MMEKPNEWAWYAGRNEEWFEAGPFSTRQEAIDTANDDFDGEAFDIVEALPGVVSFSAARLIDDQYFEAEDGFSYENGNEPDRHGKHKEADAELQALLDAWTEKWRGTFVAPSIFRETRNGEHFVGSIAEAGPLNDDESAELDALGKKLEDGCSMSLDEMSRRYVLDARAAHFAGMPA